MSELNVSAKIKKIANKSTGITGSFSIPDDGYRGGGIPPGVPPSARGENFC
jgi:hypothetical protein